MFSNKITPAFFAFAIASSLILASGFVGSAIAAKKGVDGQTNTPTDPNGTTMASTPKVPIMKDDPSSGTTGDTGSTSNKDLKSLFKCESGAAKDGDLTLGEVDDCYNQVFDQGQGQGKGDQSSSAQGNGQSQDGQAEPQIRSSILGGQNSGLMRAGIPS